MTDDLGTQIRALADRCAVIDLVATCATALDNKDWATVESCFTADAEADFGGRTGTARGAGAVADTTRRELANLEDYQHFVTNSLVRLDGDQATHTGYVYAYHARGNATYAVGCRYDDLLRRTADGWRIHRRVLTRMWKSGDPDVIRFLPA